MSQDGPETVPQMPNQHAKISGKEVRNKELGEIVRRRKVALPDDLALENSETAANSVRQNLVGLAFSGGGVRSGAFSLGLLQAFYKRGILRFVDYLSTISGGGYAGAFFSTVSLKHD